MPTFTVTVLETRINEYRIAAENADEARAAVKEGNDKVVIRQYPLEPNVLRVLPEPLASVRGERSFTVGAREEQVIDVIYWVEAKSAQEARAMVERADPSLTLLASPGEDDVEVIARDVLWIDDLDAEPTSSPYH